MNIFQSLWLYWKDSTLPFTEVFIQNSSQRSACAKCSSFENDGEFMLMVVQAHSEQQQQCF